MISIAKRIQRTEYCPACGEPLEATNVNQTKQRICERCRKRAKRLAKRIFVVMAMGSTCASCQREVESIDELVIWDVHHLRGEDKEFKLSNGIKDFGMQRLLSQCSRSVLLCCICHRQVHQIVDPVIVQKSALELASQQMAKAEASGWIVRKPIYKIDELQRVFANGGSTSSSIGAESEGHVSDIEGDIEDWDDLSDDEMLPAA